MTSQESQTVIDGLVVERGRLEAAKPVAKERARIVRMLPNAAALYREQIALGLDGDPRAALKARVAVRKLCGAIVLEPGEEAGSLWARFDLHPAALILQAGGSSGRGDRI